MADFAFTTLRPQLGRFDTPLPGVAAGRVSGTIADVPGLVDGAAQNRGLGHAFLRHVERCRARTPPLLRARCPSPARRAWRTQRCLVQAARARPLPPAAFCSCKALVLVLDLSSGLASGPPGPRPWEALASIRHELAAYSPHLQASRPPNPGCALCQH